MARQRLLRYNLDAEDPSHRKIGRQILWPQQIHPIVEFVRGHYQKTRRKLGLQKWHLMVVVVLEAQRIVDQGIGARWCSNPGRLTLNQCIAWELEKNSVWESLTRTHRLPWPDSQALHVRPHAGKPGHIPSLEE